MKSHSECCTCFSPVWSVGHSIYHTLIYNLIHKYDLQIYHNPPNNCSYYSFKCERRLSKWGYEKIHHNKTNQVNFTVVLQLQLLGTTSLEINIFVSFSF